MQISDLIHPENVFVDLAYASKTQTLQGLAKKASVAVGLPESSVLEPLYA